MEKLSSYRIVERMGEGYDKGSHDQHLQLDEKRRPAIKDDPSGP